MINKPTEKILLQELKIIFTQDNDCVEGGQNGQFLEIKTDDGGGGDFFVLKTERWAFENIDEIINILKTFKNQHDKLK